MVQQETKDGLEFLRQTEITDVRQQLSFDSFRDSPNMIHVCFGFVDKTGRYAKYAGTAMLSLFENHDTPPRLPSITVHILHNSTLTDDNRDKFIQIAERYNQLVKFHNVEELCADRIKEVYQGFPNADKRRFTIGAFYRLFIPFVLPAEIEKAIYLDGDIIVNMDINELWQIDLEDAPLGVVNTPRARYFNTGFLFMNLKVLRCEEETIRDGLKFAKENPQLVKYPLDGLLNHCFIKRALRLPEKFNCILYVPANRETIGRKIYHYVGLGSSLGMDTSDPPNRLWFSYFIRTPWFNADSIGNLYKTFMRQYNILKHLASTTSAIVACKTRAFFIEPSQINEMKKYFSIRDDEEIIPAENEESIQNLIDAMKASQGKCVFFIMTDKFLKKDFPFDKLTENDFVENKDFVKAWKYLSEDYKRQVNSISFIQYM